MLLKVKNKTTESKLVKVHIDLPNHWAVGGESMWAEPLGGDLYRIENVPFYAYGLNFKDIVSARRNSEDEILEIKEVVKPGGHKTFRVNFKKAIDHEQQVEILDSLGVGYERAYEYYVALDLETDKDYNAIYDQLERLEEKEILIFETCGARIPGSFDDTSEEE